jgi:hypothetical protein
VSGVATDGGVALDWGAGADGAADGPGSVDWGWKGLGRETLGGQPGIATEWAIR